MLIPTRITSPSTQIISLSLAKQHLRVDSNVEDLYITTLIDAVTSYLDGYSGILGQALITQTWRQKFPQFPCGADVLGLSVGPVQSVSEITYYNSANEITVLDPSVYALLTDESGSFVCLQSNNIWPVVYCREDAVKVDYVAGYGSQASSVPMAIRQAALLLIGHFYENREATAGAAMSGLSQELPFAVSALLSPFRRVGI